MAPLDGIVKARERWRQLWIRWGVRAVPERVFDELVESYEQPQRAYHRLDHVLDCLRVFDTVSSGAEHAVEVEAAIWFHDAVYEPARDDNEARSAAWALQVLREAGVSEAASDRVRQLILATRHDAPPEAKDARLLLDVDVSILGRSPAEFQVYEDQIRREYAWVPDEIFHERRAELLDGFLNRQPLFLTEPLRSRFEPQARVNLAAAVDAHRSRASTAHSSRHARPPD